MRDEQGPRLPIVKSGDTAAPGLVRQRTPSRMARLLAIAAASATLQAGCRRHAELEHMPSPRRSECTGVATTIEAKARWKPGHVVELTLGKPRLGASYHEPIQVGASGGRVLEVMRHDGALTILAHPDGDTYLGLRLDVECSRGVGPIVAQLFLHPDVEGAETPVRLDDAEY